MKKYKKNNEIEAAVIGDELGMLNVNEGKYYILDSIGKDIWGLLENEKSLEELIKELLQIYDVSKEECQKDVEELVENMVDKKFILEV